MEIIPETTNPGTITVADGHVVHTCCGKLDSQPHRNFCEHWTGYINGYLDCATAAMRRHHEREIARINREHPADVVEAAVVAIDGFYADTPEQALILLSRWSRRDELTPDRFAQLVTALFGEDEVGEALISLWSRRDRLTAIEQDTIRAALLPEDGGLAEAFLRRQQQARLGAALDFDEPSDAEASAVTGRPGGAS